MTPPLDASAAKRLVTKRRLHTFYGLALAAITATAFFLGLQHATEYDIGLKLLFGATALVSGYFYRSTEKKLREGSGGLQFRARSTAERLKFYAFGLLSGVAGYLFPSALSMETELNPDLLALIALLIGGTVGDKFLWPEAFSTAKKTSP